MRVPLTLAIVSAVVVRSGEQSFVLPQNSLVELVYLPRRDRESVVERVGTAEVYRLRDGLLPLVWLDQVLGLEAAEAEARDLYIAVLEAGGRRFGLVVDGLKAPEEIVVKPLSATLREIGMFSGATVLGNGLLALILDVGAIGARAGVRPGELAGGAVEPAAAPSAKEMECSLVIYETWKRGAAEVQRSARMALPLNSVERIERVPLRRIEWAAGRAVLQYEGELLVLEDEDELLTELEGTDAMATVLICVRGGAHPAGRVGLVVRQVHEVTGGTPIAPNNEMPGEQLAMANDRVTTLRGEIAGRPCGLREVA
jgi:two-component system chemotaxis sensor kinase CheA